MPPTHPLFVYGTLRFPEIVERLCGRRLTGERAVLPGHRCRLVAGERFPAVLPDPGEATPGLLYRQIDERLLTRLDDYEGAWYQRLLRRVEPCSGPPEEAWVYLLAPAHAHRLSDQPWDPGCFRRRHLAGFLTALP